MVKYKNFEVYLAIFIIMHETINKDLLFLSLPLFFQLDLRCTIFESLNVYVI